MITVTQAQSLIMQASARPVAAYVPLEQAMGYCLAEPVKAERDYPPFDRVTHDGIATDFTAYMQGARQFHIQGYAPAGKPRATLADSQNCIEIATGAPLPEGCDTVIPYEALAMENGIAALLPGTCVQKGDSLHLQGADTRKDTVILSSGCRIFMHEMALLATNGVAQVPVYAKPSIGIMATGDELVGVGAAIAPHQIRRSNDIVLKASLAQNGFSAETGWAPDDKDVLTAHLKIWLEEKDIVIVSGGVSRGSFDYVPDILRSLGVEKLLHAVAQRPGKPLWVGLSRHGKLVFGLPGNPVSSLVCLTRYVIPSLKAMSGYYAEPPTVSLAEPAKVHATLTLFTNVRVSNNAATPLPSHGSGDFARLHESTGFVELPPRAEAYKTGETVLYYPWAVP